MAHAFDDGPAERFYAFAGSMDADEYKRQLQAITPGTSLADPDATLQSDAGQDQGGHE